MTKWLNEGSNFNREKKRFTKEKTSNCVGMLSGRRESMRIINRGNNRNKGFVEQSKPVDSVLLKCSVYIVREEV